MNFDLDGVAQFLEGLSPNQGIALDTSSLVAFTTDTPIEEDRCIEIGAKFRGEDERLTYCVFMDGIEAPDVYFYGSNGRMIAAISQEMSDYANRLGI